MTMRRGGLGRGLGALIPTGSPEEARSEERLVGARLAEVPVSALRPNPRQPRSTFDEDALAELVASIREVGLLQPVVVREVTDGYELVMGERRWRAARQAGLSAVPAIIRDTADDALLRDALLENLHREQLNPLEEAAAYRQLLDDFGATHDELATRIGRSRSHVTNMLRLLQLPPAVQRRLAAGVLSAGHARALLGLADPAGQEALATRIVAEGLSVRATEEAVVIGFPRPAQQRRSRPAAPALRPELAEWLSTVFDTRVRVQMGRAKGRILVEFGSVEDLDRIVALMAPHLDGLTDEDRRDLPGRDSSLAG